MLRWIMREKKIIENHDVRNKSKNVEMTDGSK